MQSRFMKSPVGQLPGIIPAYVPLALIMSNTFFTRSDGSPKDRSTFTAIVSFGNLGHGQAQLPDLPEIW